MIKCVIMAKLFTTQQINFAILGSVAKNLLPQIFTYPIEKKKSCDNDFQNKFPEAKFSHLAIIRDRIACTDT